ncbi:transport permease protein [Paenibacillus lautus]|uniref:ABC transporter permease n=1 Tax=Paenibacillus lautus TaxID=1401 RepID=UPI001B1DE050|nr:ABC transporter permease [Paenibacillus lautus]GIP06889.1 transport permease protein [Paenibacillus lautus]
MSIWKYRKYLWDNSILELRNRYAGSSLGSLWNIIQPLLQILVYTFVFSQVMAAKLPGTESTTAFTIYLCAGLIPWFSFSEIIMRGSNAFIENSTYLKKLDIPEFIFLLKVALTSTIVLFISMSILFVVVFFLGGTITYLWLLVPIVLILLALMGLGLTFSFACINVFFKDFGQLLNTLIQLWMWLTPIVYVKDMLPEFFSQFVVYNPLYVYIDSLHKIIVFSEFPTVYSWMQMILFSSITMIIGLLTLKKLRSEIRDVV